MGRAHLTLGGGIERSINTSFVFVFFGGRCPLYLGGGFMANYRRSRTAGGCFFFTLVTHQRQPFLTHPEARRFLRAAILETQNRYPFSINAWVLLPDHLHAVWTLPQDDPDFSKRWGLIKAGFSKKAKPLFEKKELLSVSRIKKQESSIWQRRFWEHEICDDDDYQRHLDYIHYNPVKHGLADRVADWPHSTFHRYVALATYPEDWGGALDFSGEFGE